MDIDPALDLQIEREINVPVARVWAAWTSPDILPQWFCPRPWRVVACDIDLRPGGVFRTVMQSPQGDNLPANEGSYLVVEPERRLVWTNMLGRDFRPLAIPAGTDEGPPAFHFVVDLAFTAISAQRTHYRAIVRHASEAARQVHESMGFQQGWNIALDQLIEVMSPASA